MASTSVAVAVMISAAAFALGAMIQLRDRTAEKGGRHKASRRRREETVAVSDANYSS